MEHILETERLRLRKFTLDDTDFIIRLLNSPGWLEFIGDRNVKTKKEAEAYLINGPMKSYEVNGYGLCMVEIKDHNTPIGMCGIINRANMEGQDIGFAFLTEYIGLGYGYEIASATLDYAMNELKLPRVLAITLPTNKPSIKLLEKIGLRFQKNFTFPDEIEELMLFSN